MMKSYENVKAVAEFVEKAAIEDYLADLENYWECWLTHDDNSTISVEERRNRLYRYKAGKEFLQALLEIDTKFQQ